jgi:hypothetical protein
LFFVKKPLILIRDLARCGDVPKRFLELRGSKIQSSRPRRAEGHLDLSRHGFDGPRLATIEADRLQDEGGGHPPLRDSIKQLQTSLRNLDTALSPVLAAPE